MDSYTKILVDRIKKTQSCICVGIDPDRTHYFIEPTELRNWCHSVINIICDAVPACKFQLAFFEEYGELGTKVVSEAICYAKQKGLLTILDFKRSDVPHVFKSVIRHSFGNSFTGQRESPDAITINPFISLSSIFSILEEIHIPSKCIYVSTNAYGLPNTNIPESLINAADTFSDELTSTLSAYRSESISLQSIELGLVSSCIFPVRLTATATSFKGPILIPGYGVQAGNLPQKFSEFSKMRCLVSVSRSMIPKGTTKKNVWESTIISNISHLNNLIKV